MLVDTHAHLYADQFAEDREEMLRRAFNNGVDRIYLPNIDSDSIESMFALEEKFPDQCFAMMGLHPCSVKENYKEELAIVKKWLDTRPFKAVGEIGIDLYWDKTFLEAQKEAFRMQIEWAKELELPIVIHARESLDIIIDMVRSLKDDRLRGIFHCFTGSIEQAQSVMNIGDFMMGLGGVLTFKNSGLDAVVKEIPMDYLVLETDAPYLSPTPYRGKRNESSYIRLVAEKLASIKEIGLDEVGQKTSRNADQIFEPSN